MISLAQDLLSEKAALIWIGALFFVLVFHCRHLICMRGERRCYHLAHVVMLLGMLYMYASTAIRLDWIPTSVWITVYVVISAAIIGWMTEQFRRRGSFGNLWALALVQQGAMVYMWMPMNDWIPLLSYGFSLYFGLEAVAWLIRASMQPSPAEVFAGSAGSDVVSLAPRSVVGDICMTIMAASMGYMFAGMQLMMSMPRASEQIVQQQQLTPPQKTGETRAFSKLNGKFGNQRLTCLQITPRDRRLKLDRLACRRVTPSSLATFLHGIAARFYEDARQWPNILKANPGLDPRRLRIGRVIKLPKPVPFPIAGQSARSLELAKCQAATGIPASRASIKRGIRWASHDYSNPLRPKLRGPL